MRALGEVPHVVVTSSDETLSEDHTYTNCWDRS
jgi:hypothetical protein